MKLISTIRMVGNKRDGWILTIADNVGFKGDIAVNYEEAVMLRDLLISKIK